MSPSEQKAFVAAYATHVAYVEKEQVADFVEKTYSGASLVDLNKIVHCTEQSSILDALGMWQESAKWLLEQALKNNAPFNPQFLGAQPPQAGQDY
jgi:hypothetical protein